MVLRQPEDHDHELTIGIGWGWCMKMRIALVSAALLAVSLLGVSSAGASDNISSKLNYHAADAFIQAATGIRSEEHTSELQSPCNLVCRLLLEKKKKIAIRQKIRHAAY